MKWLRPLIRLSIAYGLSLCTLFLYRRRHPELPILSFSLILLTGCYGLEELFSRFSLNRVKQLGIALVSSMMVIAICRLVIQRVLPLFDLVITPPYDLGLLVFGGYLVTLLMGKLAVTAQSKQKLIMPSPALLEDNRLLGLVSCGLFNDRLVLPSFLAADYPAIVRSLNDIKGLNLSIVPVSCLEKTQDKMVVEAAKILDADLLCVDSRLQELVNARKGRLYSLHSLGTALKPIVPSGEHLSVKIQRLGKELDQGVGYLEDGTMVVVNGGGLFVGETVNSQVLSIRQTPTGRMIFCNLTT